MMRIFLTVTSTIALAGCVVEPPVASTYVPPPTTTYVAPAAPTYVAPAPTYVTPCVAP